MEEGRGMARDDTILGWVGLRGDGRIRMSEVEEMV